MKKLLLSIFSVLGIVLFYGNNAYADSGFVTQSEGNRTVYLESRGWSMTDGIADGNAVGNIPFNIVSSAFEGHDVDLVKVQLDFPRLYLGDSSREYNNYNFYITFKQDKSNYGWSSTWNYRHVVAKIQWRLRQTQNADNYEQCAIYRISDIETVYKCNFVTDNYHTIDYVKFYAESDDPGNNWVAFISGISTNVSFSNPNPIKVQEVFWEYTTSDNPMTSSINQMLQNQQIIINQYSQMLAQQNQTNQWLQDTTPPSIDTSSLNTSVGWMPPGPVDSILTLPLQLLQGIVNVFTNTNCSPLQVPVPYVNETITLPCVSTLMDDIGFTPIWSIVGGVISAVIIWDTLKWLYKFVDDTLTFRENNSGIWGGL